MKEVTRSIKISSVARRTEGTRSAAMTVNDTKAAIRTFKACIKETNLSSATASQLSLQTLSDQNFYMSNCFSNFLCFSTHATLLLLTATQEKGASACIGERKAAASESLNAQSLFFCMSQWKQSRFEVPSCL